MGRIHNLNRKVGRMGLDFLILIQNGQSSVTGK